MSESQWAKRKPNCKNLAEPLAWEMIEQYRWWTFWLCTQSLSTEPPFFQTFSFLFYFYTTPRLIYQKTKMWRSYVHEPTHLTVKQRADNTQGTAALSPLCANVGKLVDVRSKSQCRSYRYGCDCMRSDMCLVQHRCVWLNRT